MGNVGMKGVPGPGSNWGKVRIFLWKLKWVSPLRRISIFFYGCYK
jgi:hypothetical protein